MRVSKWLARSGAAAGATTLSLSTLVFGGGTIPAVASGVTNTPVQHVVIIFQENESFDHYFGTYPVASNPGGEDTFTPVSATVNSTAANTTINNLVSDAVAGGLLSGNPNGANPARLDPGANGGGMYNATLNLGTGNDTNAGIDNVLTCSQNHNYQPEQLAFDGGAMDKFPGNVGSTSSPPEPGAPTCTANQDLDYYDGNTVTGYWNYAQHFAMSDNSFGTTFGPSTPGAINVISGDTGNFNEANGATLPSGALTSPNSALVPDGDGAFSDINDADPFYDDCSSSSSNIGISNVSATGPTAENVGDQLSMAGISWGWFQGGFAPQSAASGTMHPGYAGGPGGQGTGYTPATCTASHNKGAALGGTGSTGTQPYGLVADYVQHHDPFQYYATTANPSHLVPIQPDDGRQRHAKLHRDLLWVRHAGVQHAQPPVRHQRVQPACRRHYRRHRRFDRRQPPSGQLPQGCCIPGRTPEQFRPDRRSDLRDPGDQLADAKPRLAHDRCRGRLRRL